MEQPRYHRQELLIGKNNQKKLQTAKVAIVGAGALGTLSAELLIRAGIHYLTIIDRDIVEITNLQRQISYTEQDVGKSKANTLKNHLQQINQNATIIAHATHLNTHNINLLKDHDLILDATDNLQTRFLINDFAKKYQTPWIYAAGLRDEGYIMPIYPQGPCLSCFLKPAQLETCDTSGVFAMTTTIIASIQSYLAIQILINNYPQPYLTHVSLKTLSTKNITIKKAANCPTCTKKYLNFKKSKSDLIQFCSTGRFQRQTTVKIDHVRPRWKKHRDFTEDPLSISLPAITLFRDGRVLIKAKTKEQAQSVFSKFIGN